MPRFSIVTVCLNEVDSIRRTCESICSQTFDDFEWIVIDGQSTDGTLDVLSEYEARINTFISEADGGIYDAMNKGMRISRGEHLLFMNAGDYFSGQMSLQLVKDAPDKDILYGDVLCVDAEGESFTMNMPDTLPINFLLNKMMPHQATFIRRNLFDKYGEYDCSYRIAGDYDLFVRFLSLHKVTSFHVPHILSVFITDGISSTPSSKILRKKENHLIRKKYFPRYRYGLKGLKTELQLRLRGHA
ncbi:MAG: glycosyltransferase family 2 protein [Desulfuromonadales bacterium]